VCQWVLVRVLYCTVHFPYSTIKIQQRRLVHGSSKTSPATRALYRTEQSQGSSPTRRCGSSHSQTPALVGLGKPVTRYKQEVLVPENGICLYGHPDTGASIILREMFSHKTGIILLANCPSLVRNPTQPPGT